MIYKEVLEMQKSPVCFIAMAFGRDDTDLFYEKQILPVLKRNGVKPVIINRHQSNDDLNFQIFDQLEKADFCIADLTYTRPSVYFEAGYAQRVIPVVYTVRKDHLGKGQPDDLRVHFDLQMKPIIDWKNSDDLTFASRLEKRLRATVLKEWNRLQNEDKKYEIEKAKFQKLPQYKKLIQLRRQTLYGMRQIGINISQWNASKYSFQGDTLSYIKKSITNGYVDHIFGVTNSNSKIVEVSIQAYPSLNKKTLYDLQGAYSKGVYDVERDNSYKADIFLAHIMVLSLRPVTANQIESVFSSFTPLIESKRYVSAHVYEGSRKRKRRKHTVITTFHFLTGIESEYHLKILLDNLVDDYIEPQMNTSNRKLNDTSF